MELIKIVSLAYLIDMFIGDPHFVLHPVRVMGMYIASLEKALKNAIKNKRSAGIILVILVLFPGYAGSYFLVKTVYDINYYAGFFLSVLMVFSCISVKNLKDEVFKILNSLKQNDLESARKNLSMIVGRDTQNLEEEAVIRASIETVSESTVDGVIAPLFYVFIGGVPLMILYKAVNTLDSMVGYKNEEYKDFGWASARLDDILNFIPSRISVFIMSLAAAIICRTGLSAFRIALRDGRKHPSPNSGIPEAVVAGALGIRLGGLNYYSEQAYEKPYIGDAIRSPELSDIAKSLKITYLSSFIALVLGIILRILI